MANDPLFSNKVFGAILLAGVIAAGSGFVSNLVYHPAEPEKDSYPIEVAESNISTTDSDIVVDATQWSIVSEALAATENAGGTTLSDSIASGSKLFKKCASCHSIEEGGPTKTGPNLWSIVNRTIASVDGYSYSSTLKDMGTEGKVWDFEALNGFLTKPKTYAPGTKMGYNGLKKSSDRIALILYLKSQSPQ